MSTSGTGLDIGLFGGTFDPVHQGHLDLARHVLDCCRLDRLLIIPAPLPPHKRQPVASFDHRVAMLEAALADAPGNNGRLLCSRIETGLPLPSYTINTVEALLREQSGHRYALIIGADSLIDLPHWHRGVELSRLIDLIVVKRDPITRTMIDALLAALSPRYRFVATENRWRGENDRSASYLADIELPVSSSSIREALARGTVPAMLPPVVLAYIKQHQLYGFRETS